MNHDADIFDKKGNKAGNIVFKTEFQWQEYILPQPSSKLDKKSLLKIIIKEAQFMKDADTFGKQDPYIQFMYQDKQLKTDVKDDAGKHAKWDETFLLPSISSQVRDGGALVFEVYDKDVMSSD